MLCCSFHSFSQVALQSKFSSTRPIKLDVKLFKFGIMHDAIIVEQTKNNVQKPLSLPIILLTLKSLFQGGRMVPGSSLL